MHESPSRNAGGRQIEENMLKELLLSTRGVIAALALMLGMARGVVAQERAATGPAPATTSDLAVPAGRSSVVQTPWPVIRVSVTDPKTADVQVLTPRQVLVSGKMPGSTDLILWSKDEEIHQIRLEVSVDRTALKTELKRLFPRAGLDLRQSGEVVVVTGTLERAEEAEQLHRFLDATGLKYADMSVLPGVQQVQIKVIVAEASRNAVRALGVNALAAGSDAVGAIKVGSENGGPLNPGGGDISFGDFGKQTISPAVTLFGALKSADLAVFVQALAENQYVRLLAEPTLVALSGQDASFLAGGEFPIPVVQSGVGGGSNGASISIEYKEFGVRLKFRPIVLGNNAIRLHVAPEVSELSNGPGSVQIQGFSVPAILARRAETTMELHSGQTFAMAGLMSQKSEARNSRVPVMGDLPIIGALFRSVRYQRGDTELVVLVTATLVEPSSSVNRPLLPGSLHAVPADWELYLLGRIEGHGPAMLSPTDAKYLKDLGLDRLKGPGAWATYDSGAATGSAAMSPVGEGATQSNPGN